MLLLENTDSVFINIIVKHIPIMLDYLQADLAMRLKNNLQPKTIATITIIALILSPLMLTLVSGLQFTTTSEYTNYVHTFVNSENGNYTMVEKPIFPVMINNTQISIGANWTIICPLQAGHNYHVYCYGAWVNISPTAKTDYDINVYNPEGNLESSHTEAAGLPEHLGTTTNDALFTPAESGNYSFVLINDARESQGAQQATFMIIENLETDKWHSVTLDGKDEKNLADFHTSWAYEFVTNESKVELYVKVPNTLDMYEARLYLMNSANSLSINSYPLPLESGLYGILTGIVGGYNFETEAYRGVAYESCEYPGESMFLNYTSKNAGANLYHLVLVGEVGSGDVQFMLKSHFGNTTFTSLNSPLKLCPNTPAQISYIANNANLESAQLAYSVNNWTDVSSLEMAISNQICNATIPGQTAGSTVQFRVDATDFLENNLTVTGNYTVKEQPILNVMFVKANVTLGQNITVTGTLTPNTNNSVVNVQFFNTNTTQAVDAQVNSNGTFSASFKPNISGDWRISASSPETKTTWRCDSDQLIVMVKEPPIYVKYSLYIIIGIVAACAASGVVWFLKFREK
jgi:hypothetical protein